MKTVAFIILIFNLFDNHLFSQRDTVTWDPHGLSQKMDGHKKIYLIDNKPVTKPEWDAMVKHNSEVDKELKKCKPCWLKMVSPDLSIKEGEFYNDIPIGVYKERYPDGTIKVRGQYQKPLNYQRKKAVSAGSIKKTGMWSYYDISGKIEKTEEYKDGVLVK